MVSWKVALALRTPSLTVSVMGMEPSWLAPEAILRMRDSPVPVKGSSVSD